MQELKKSVDGILAKDKKISNALNLNNILTVLIAILLSVCAYFEKQSHDKVEDTSRMVYELRANVGDLQRSVNRLEDAAYNVKR